MFVSDVVCSMARKLPSNVSTVTIPNTKPNSTPTISAVGDGEEDCPSASKKVKVGGYRQRFAKKSVNPEALPTSISVSDQLDKYLNLDIEEGSTAINFWSSKEAVEKFPALAKLATTVLSVPATSAPVERVFSHGGIIMRPHRATMTEKNLANLIFLKCNRLEL